MTTSINFLEQWKPIRVIGEGSTCDVVLVQNKNTRQTEVVKLFKLGLKVDTIEHEAKVMSSLDHPNIISAKGFFPQVNVTVNEQESQTTINEQVSVISLEYASKGDLLGLVQSLGGLPEIISRAYMHQLVDALEHVHSKDICHLDIKPDNILVDKDYNLKLGDFGLSLEIPKDSMIKGVVGTPVYFAPEMHTKVKYSSYDADIFALGITLFIMVNGNMPFGSAKASDPVYSYIAEEKFDEFWNFHDKLKNSKTKNFSSELKDLIQRMFAFNPKKRLSLKGIRDHAWFRGVVPSAKKLSAYMESAVGQQ